MEARGWLFALVGLIALAGCLGADEDPALQEVEDASVEEETEHDEDEASRNAASNEAEEDGAERLGEEDREEPVSPVDPCKEQADNVRAFIAEKREDPFGNESTLDPAFLACPEEGILLLAAHGIEGAKALQFSFTVPEETTCDAYRAVALGGAHHRYYGAWWDQPDQVVSYGGGWGGGSGLPVSVFAGPIDTDEAVTDAVGGPGFTGFGGSSHEVTFRAGEHVFTFASPHWMAWENSLTQGAALVFMIACEDALAFEHAHEASMFEMFSDRSLQAGAGASTSLSGASAGHAVSTSLEEEGMFRGVGYAFEGAAGIHLMHEEGTSEHLIAPQEGWTHAEAVPEGPFEATLAQAGTLTGVIGLVNEPMPPTDIETFLEA